MSQLYSNYPLEQQRRDSLEIDAERRAECVARFCPPEPYEPPRDTRTIDEKMASHRAYAVKHLSRTWHADEIERWLALLRRDYAIEPKGP